MDIELLTFPDDILSIIFSYLNYIALLALGSTCKYFSNDTNKYNIRSLLVKFLNNLSQLKIDNYTFQQLIRLSRIVTEKSIITCGKLKGPLGG